MVDILRFDFRDELRREFARLDRCGDVLDLAVSKITEQELLPSQIHDVFRAILDWELGSEIQTDMVVENTNVVEIMAAICVNALTAGLGKGFSRGVAVTEEKEKRNAVI